MPKITKHDDWLTSQVEAQYMVNNFFKAHKIGKYLLWILYLLPLVEAAILYLAIR